MRNHRLTRMKNRRMLSSVFLPSSLSREHYTLGERFLPPLKILVSTTSRKLFLIWWKNSLIRFHHVQWCKSVSKTRIKAKNRITLGWFTNLFALLQTLVFTRLWIRFIMMLFAMLWTQLATPLFTMLFTTLKTIMKTILWTIPTELEFGLHVVYLNGYYKRRKCTI